MKKLDNGKEQKSTRPALKAGSAEWCHRLRMTALVAALRTAKAAKLTAGEVVSLMKIRRSLLEQIREKREVIWMDPPHWKEPLDSGPMDHAA